MHFSAKIFKITALLGYVVVNMRQIFSLITLLFAGALTAHTIPILHIQDYSNEKKREAFLNSFEHAIKDVGYFFIEDVDLDFHFIDTAYAQAKVFFASDGKQQYLSPKGQRGYVPGESAKGETRIDSKEFYHIGRELQQSDLERLRIEQNVWPKNPQAFQSVMEPIYTHIDTFKNTLGEAFSVLLDQKKEFVRDMIKEGDSIMRVVHYPGNLPENAIWAGMHTDINLFSIYPPASGEGLQVQTPDGTWLDINIPRGMLFVHCGDMIENLSNGLCKATIHRVVNNDLCEDRYAIVFFVHPRSDDRLDPLPSCIKKTGGVCHYANLSRMELLTERLIDLGLTNKELMDFFVRSGAIQKLKEVGRFSSKAEHTLIEEGFLTAPSESP